MRMIIRNCPAFVQSSYKNRDWAIENACELIDDRCCLKQNCILKQIVERCQKEQEYHKEWQKETGFNYAATGLRLANEILKLLDIQECE